MEPQVAFARAWKFLNFKPVAKWTALVAAVGTAVLYILLLLVLGLFADLIAHRGQVPAYAELPAAQRDALPQAWKRISPEDRSRRLEELKDDDDAIKEQTIKKLTADDLGKLTADEQNV